MAAAASRNSPCVGQVHRRQESGEDLERIDEHPPVGDGISDRECGLDVSGRGVDVAVVEIESGQVEVAMRHRRPGAGGLTGVDCELRVASSHVGVSEPSRDRGHSIGNRPFHRVVAELAKELKRLLAGTQRGFEIGPLPVSERQRRERLTSRQRIAAIDGDGQGAAQCGQRRLDISFVGEQ